MSPKGLFFYETPATKPHPFTEYDSFLYRWDLARYDKNDTMENKDFYKGG